MTSLVTLDPSAVPSTDVLLSVRTGLLTIGGAVLPNNPLIGALIVIGAFVFLVRRVQSELWLVGGLAFILFLLAGGV